MNQQSTPAVLRTFLAPLARARDELAKFVADATRDRRLLRLLIAFPAVVVLAIIAMMIAFHTGTAQLDAAFDDFIAANEIDEHIDHMSLALTGIQALDNALRTDSAPLQLWKQETADAGRYLGDTVRDAGPARSHTIALDDVVGSFARYRAMLARYVDDKTLDAPAREVLLDQADAVLTNALAYLSRAKKLTQARMETSVAAYTRGRDDIRATIFLAILFAFGAAAVACGLLLMRLMTLLREAESVSRTRGDFLSMMGHELRTPLNAVIGFGQLIEREAFGPLGSNRYKVYMRLMNNAAQDLLTFVNNLLDLSRVDTKAHVELKSVTAASLVSTTLTFLGTLREKQPIAITQSIDADISVSVDPAMITKALIAIVGNAIKFNKDTGSVDISAHPAAPGWVAVIVRDTGVGIPAHLLSKITEPFFQVGHGNTRRFDGGGIGLSVARQLIELNRGELSITSELDKGTVVTLRLPAALAAQAAA